MKIFQKVWPKIGERLQVPDVVLRLGEKINTTPKIVVAGNTLMLASHGARLKHRREFSGANFETQIKALKDAEGGDIITMGSPTLVQSLINAGLVDEYRIYIHPVVVSEGRRLFENLGSAHRFAASWV